MPTPAWNDTFDEGLIWQEGAFLAMFEQAVWERQQVVGTPPPVLPVFTPSETVAGQVVQGVVRKWQDIIAHFTGSGYGGYYFSDAGLCQHFILPDLEIGSTVPGDWPAAWLNDQICWQPNTLLDAVNGHEGWTRRYERRIATLASALYTDGQSPTEGDLVRCLADWRVYLRAGGSWTLSGETTGDTVTAYGNMQVGDYIGHWCFTELREALNRLMRSYHPGTLVDKKSHMVYGPGYTNSDTMSGARGLAEGLWPGEFASSYPISAWKRTYRWDDGGIDKWWAEIGRDTSKVRFIINPVVSVDCGVWLYFERCGSGHGVTMETFDNQGDHAAGENTYWLWEMVSPVDVTPFVTGQFSDEVQMPPNWGPSPPSGGAASEMLSGYHASNPLIIADWQFTQRGV